MKEQNEIIENLEEETHEVMENVDTETEEVVDTVEENTEAAEETAENIDETTEEKVEEVEEVEEDEVEDIDSHIKNLKKNDAAELLIKKAKIIVHDSENQLEECKLLLANDLKDYENAKQVLEDNGMTASEKLLSELGYESEESIELPEDMVVFEPKEELQPIHIRDTSSGAFTGFILALIAGIATLAGMVFAYIAIAKVGISLNFSKMPTVESLTPIMKWYASLVGMGDTPAVGGAMIVLVVLLVMWIVYKIRVGIRASSNLNMAKAQLTAAEEYSVQKGTCKEEMDKIDSYIHEAIETLKLYQVILNEQKGKLERILHLENDKIESSDFHHKSNIEMKDTQELISAIKDFMSVPMSEEGKLSGKSSLFLHRAKSKIQKVIERLY